MMFREGQVCEEEGLFVSYSGAGPASTWPELNEVIEGADAGDQGSN